jgi:hypothetical protein
MKLCLDLPDEQREVIESAVTDLVAGRVNKATARLNAMLGLRAAGAWHLTESDWLDDIIDTNFSLRCGWRDYCGLVQQAVIRDRWPANELISVHPQREVRDWVKIWVEKSGRLSDGLRMIALHDNPIWAAVSEFGLPFAPFARASFTRTRLVTREDAMDLGLIDRDRQITLEKSTWSGALILWPPPVEDELADD